MTAGSTCRTALAVALAVAFASPAGAQYFGRNKVQYKTFDFQVLRTEHFDIYFYPEERQAAQQASLMAERWHARLSKVLSHQLTGRQPLILYASHPEFEQTNVVSGELGEGTGGVTEVLKRRIVLPLGTSLAETDHVIGHELVHAFQFDITSSGSRSAAPGALRLPLWFVEGMAEYLSIGPVDPHTAMWMRDAASQEKIPAVRDLDDPRYFPYRWGQAFWTYVTGRWGDRVVGDMLRLAGATGDFEVAFSGILGQSSDELSVQWHGALREQAALVRQQTRPPGELGRVLQRAESDEQRLNVAPALSPDGRRLMFLSQRDLLSLDLYLANAETGKIIRKVTNTAVDPHFDSIQFIASAGDWAPDNRRFVFAVVRGGSPGLAIYDAGKDRMVREIEFGDLGEIFNPSWSPDGRRIAFTALQGGLTDLFVHDLEAGTTRRLTHDPFADLYPEWSPDGRRLAFATDRFSTRLENLQVGNYQVAVIDADGGNIRLVPGASDGKNINPQWAADGSLFFVSDRNGISNVYRAPADGGEARQITNLATGVSGITAGGPAISYAPGARRLALSVYENARYNLYAIEEEQRLAGDVPMALAGLQPARLPPQRREAGELPALQANPTIGLAGARNAQEAPYQGGLSLDFVGQPYLTAGVDPYGTFAGGGISLFWSDMLGNYSLGTAIQVNNSFGGDAADILKNTGAQVAFQNLKHRWNYGLSAGQTPYLAGGFASGVTRVDGDLVGVQQQYIQRQIERSVSGIVAYPFSRVHRLELSGGFTNISFDQRLDSVYFDLQTGRVLAEERQDLPAPGGLSLGQGTAALVYDTSIFGATSPIAGQSYRIQVSPTVGSIRFNQVLADFRRYLVPVSFYTVAVRGLHFGRYGRDSEDPRLVPLFLGYPGLVRGYDFNTFSAGECTVTPGGSCLEFDRLLGSRVLVGNVELRFPLLRPLGVDSNMYGPIPVEVAFFADAGVAWSAGQRPDFTGADRRGVTSAGVAFRVNVLGFVVAQFDVARPFQRPGQGWVFHLSLTPGF